MRFSVFFYPSPFVPLFLFGGRGGEDRWYAFRIDGFEAPTRRAPGEIFTSSSKVGGDLLHGTCRYVLKRETRGITLGCPAILDDFDDSNFGSGMRMF